jgi:hypothetical protein
MLPDFVEPCLPSPADRPPSDPGWVHEIKHDGFRWPTPPASACSLVTGTTGRGEPLIVEAVNRLWVTTANQERELREIAGRMGCEIVKVLQGSAPARAATVWRQSIDSAAHQPPFRGRKRRRSVAANRGAKRGT